MLILAGVSLNATIGENGIITQAQNAKEKSKIVAIMEELEIMLFDFNTSGNTKSSALKAYMEKQVAKGKIDSFRSMRKDNNIQCLVEKDGYLFYVIPEEEIWKVVLPEEGTAYGGVELEVYTKENVNVDGTFEFQSETEKDVVFYDKVEGNLNFDIIKGIVNIYIYNDMTLTNKDLKDESGNPVYRSAVNIHEGATLNLYLEDNATMTVDSGFGQDGEEGNEEGAKGGPGGFAGVHVPKTEKGEATFNIDGDGTLIAYGGDAGSGSDGSNIYGGGRRRSELEQELEGMEAKVEMLIKHKLHHTVIIWNL